MNYIDLSRFTSPCWRGLQSVPCSTCNITDFYHCFVLTQIAARLYLPLVADRWLPLGLPRIENRRSQI